MSLIEPGLVLICRHGATIPGSDEYREMHGYMRVSCTNATDEPMTSGSPVIQP